MAHVNVFLYGKKKSLSLDSMLIPPEKKKKKRIRLWWTSPRASEVLFGNQQLIPKYNSFFDKNPEKFHSQSGIDRWNLGEEREGEGDGKGKRVRGGEGGGGKKKRDWR